MTLGHPKQVRNTREHIIRHAQKLFAKKGFEATSMSDIAKKVKIEKASLYYFFKDKEHLFSATMEDLWGRLFSDLEKMSGRQHDFGSTGGFFTVVLQHVIERYLKAGLATIDIYAHSGREILLYRGMLKNISKARKALRDFLQQHHVRQPGLAEEVIANAIHAYVIDRQCHRILSSPKQYAGYLSSLFIK